MESTKRTILATKKHFTQKRLNRFTLRTKEKVNVQWMLFALVHNIEKIAHYGMAY